MKKLLLLVLALFATSFDSNASPATAKMLVDGHGFVIPGQYYDAGTDAYIAVATAQGLPITGSISSTPDQYVVTQTIITCTSTTGTLLASNSSRKSLKWMNTGAVDVTITPGASAAVATVGMIYQAGSLNKQGSSEAWEHGAPTNAFQCITASGSATVTVWEGQ